MNDMRKLMEALATLNEETEEGYCDECKCDPCECEETMDEGIIGNAMTDVGRKMVGKVSQVDGLERMVRLTVEQVIGRLEIGLQSRNSNDPEFLQKLIGDARRELIDLRKWMRKSMKDPLGLKD